MSFEFQPTPRVNAYTPKECVTCHGDRYVVVATRPPEQTPWMKKRGITSMADRMLEEYAPCPDCNAGVNTGFQRFDGSWARTLDVAKTRELMGR